ncbi:MAG: hypothetical protein KGL35_08375 [Bradyrhizobium sp.]|nr:hypothetical protein [Bradyrhizobium sp.]
MSQITQQGALNTTALIVPDLYVQIVPPSVALLNGVPSNVLGLVGTASWGPVNAPTTVSNMADYARQFGAVQNRKYDLGTAVAAAVLQGANNFRCVRVTDGTDVAATSTLNNGAVASVALAGTLTGYTAGATIAFAAPPAGGVQATGVVNGTGTLTGVTITNPGSGYTVAPAATITAISGGAGATATASLSVAGASLTAKYTGTLGNSLQATIASGSQSGTYRLTVAIPGQVPEVFDNIGAGLSGNALWVAIANAVNNGLSGLRGPSQLVVASAGAGVTAPAVGTAGQTQTFASGTDGATTINASVLVGQDVAPRKGMYSLRSTGASVVALADADDSTTWSAQNAYGLSEGSYMILTGPAGDTIANAVSVKASAGIDSYASKLLLGDWVYFNDVTNGVTRLISPQGFVAGRLSNLAPQESSLNKPLYGVVGTQKSYQNLVYSTADLQQLAQAGIDVIANPIPSGNSFGVRIGHNTSSNAATNGDNYTRMTNYEASTFAAGLGLFIGRLQTSQPNDPLRREVKATLDSYLQAQQDQVQVDDFSVQCDSNNNPPNRIALGYLQADVKVRYLSVVEKFLLNIEGGQSVSITRQQTTPA